MITQLELFCFRKHQHLVIDFTAGLNTLRGSNESGKSTINEALGYAFFGTDALRDTFAETVTWGCKETELKVIAKLTADGKTFTFSRSKSGASVYLNGEDKPHVTGQKEVSAFAAMLLGGDRNTAPKLMFAEQGKLRGALEKGPKETSALIEHLADLDVIERIITAAQEKLQLGNTKVLEDRLETAETAVKEFVVPPKPDEAGHVLWLAAANERLADLTSRAKLANEAHQRAQDAFLAESQKRDQAVKLTGERQQYEAQFVSNDESRTRAAAAAKAPVEDIAPIEQAIATASDFVARTEAHAKFQSLPAVTARMSREEYNVALAACREREGVLQRAYTAATTELKLKRTTQLTSTICPTCGQETAHLAHIAEQRAKDAADIKALEEKIESLIVGDKENDAQLAVLAGFDAEDKVLSRALAALTGRVDIDDGFIPSDVAWKGDVPIGTAPDLGQLRTRLAAVRAAQAERAKAQGQVEALDKVLADLATKISALTTAIADLALVSDEAFAELNNEYLRTGTARCDGEIEALNGEIERVKTAYQQMLTAFEGGEAQKRLLEANVATVKKDIAEINFNNALVKKLRAARPQIADQVWGLVLNTVSTLFSKMRGEQSIVTKTADGFCVNGRSVLSLSGSTLDILGLAIRAALLKTFLPACQFIVLDEPAQGCDETRTASLIGYVAASGFTQVLMATHEDTSEALAANLIQL